MKLSEYLISYRTQHGLSQRQFAAKCGLSNGYISMIENEYNPKTKKPVVPTMSVIKKISKGLGITAQELFSIIEDCPIELSPSEDDNRKILIDMINSLSDEGAEQVKQFIEYILSKEGN